jgi:antitoxin component of RelBE/YafQ-DinJ toxin-antitoxin module
MDSKLTLKLNKDVIEKAKQYAHSHNISLSRLVESFLASVSSTVHTEDKEIVISPFISSLADGKRIPLDMDLKYEYYSGKIFNKRTSSF